jgi:DNA-binding transcriptional LysR family regulator
MELKQIKYFLSVAETLNFTQASEQHGVSQPALTRSIQNLENEFGGLLIIRDGKNTRLTELGEKIRSEFTNIIESEERAKLLAQDHLYAGHSVLNIGIANSLGPAKFVLFFTEFLLQHPNIRIVLHQIDQRTSDEAILSGYLDACICTKRSKPNYKIDVTPLFEERLLLAFADDSHLADKTQITLEELSKENYFDRLNCEFRPNFIAMMDEMQLDIQPLLQSDREDWIQQLVVTGKGVCTLGEYSAVIPSIKMRPVKGMDVKRTVAISFILGSAASPAIVAFKEMAKNYSWA